MSAAIGDAFRNWAPGEEVTFYNASNLTRCGFVDDEGRWRMGAFGGCESGRAGE